ncbi:tripartite tricarboxylate transporter TctB family protein [Pseudooctadecabacter jejudonensis]|uniref:Tripartite tricarboxylate transporter TctB family protein n=1 Tax=Pseudooctadecabacter jejudonensis TaxID=1391910 RepID=A0A1Y5SJC1_9RHOB|nr:tripartite tricarboxylate transporter TctB family protein [Pseudooctadecabacter jejudonensis]SLN40942.1 Tripartite tricarboxylate transporter TctB family protein [Pseudooctadecabacter jejudonensis]
MTDLPRTQHIIASGGIAAVGVIVAYISFTQEPADAFIFPRLISSVFAVLAIWTFGKAVMGRTKVGNGISGEAMRNMLPGLIVMIIYVFWAAKALGFYTATTITFFIMLSLYDPAPHGAFASWAKRIAITAGFLLVMYGLFALLLNVFTPREVFF